MVRFLMPHYVSAFLTIALSRASVVFALQNWLAETPEQKRTAGSPGYISIGMACTFPQISLGFLLPQTMLTKSATSYVRCCCMYLVKSKWRDCYN